MIIFHIDVNNAFLSWESVYRLQEEGETLDLRTVASVIGGSEKMRHGIVLAKSPIAKSYGIQTAETLPEARKKCPGLLVVPPRHEIYKKYSDKLIKYLRSLTTMVEQYSIDEVFVDMTDSALLHRYSVVEAANYIRTEIEKQFGFTVNIGISSCKILAKMASDFEKPNKVHTLFPDEIAEKMWPLPVRDLFFVGKSSEQKLYTLGIRTIGELAAFDPAILQSHMGKHGLLIHEYANGIDPSPVVPHTAENKGYGNSTTLPKDVTDVAEAKQILRQLCNKIASRLQKDEMRAFVVVVSIRDHKFHQVSHQCSMISATNNAETLHTHCCRLFDEIWDGSPIRLLGVSTSKLTKHAAEQLNLLDMPFIASSIMEKPTLSAGEYLKRQTRLDEAVQKIQDKYGKNAISKGNINL
ncbi:MAG: DNA polymerase thumb domain-containing protein [Eubacterium sp.]